MKTSIATQSSRVASALAALVVLLGLTASTALASSGNDDFPYAESLSEEMPLEFNDSNVGTGTQVDEPPLGPDGSGHTIWFDWQAPASGSYVISTCASNFPSRVDLYEGNRIGYADSLVPIDQARGPTTPAEECRYIVTATESEVFEIRVDGLAYDEATGGPLAGEGAVKLQITPVAPLNDDFADAERKFFTNGGFLAEYEYELRVEHVNDYAATSEPGEQSHGGQPASASLWYVFTTPATWEPGYQSWNAVVSPGWAPRAGHLWTIYRGSSLTTLEPVETDSSGNQIELAPGVTYYLAIDEKYDFLEDRRSRGSVSFALDLRVPWDKNPDYIATMREIEEWRKAHEDAQAATGPPAPAAPPQTNLSRRAISTEAAVAKFTFTSEPRATFRCRLDSGHWGTCKSPKIYRNLANGRHTFRVAAVGSTGASDSTPALVRFKIAKQRHGHPR